MVDGDPPESDLVNRLLDGETVHLTESVRIEPGPESWDGRCAAPVVEGFDLETVRREHGFRLDMSSGIGVVEAVRRALCLVGKAAA